MTHQINTSNLSKLAIIAGILLIGCSIQAVWEQVWESQEGFRDEPRAITTDHNGNVIVFGTYSPPWGAEDYHQTAVLLKYAQDGALVFALPLDVPADYVFPRAVTTDNAGFIYAPVSDHLFKVSPQGRLEWTVTLPGNGNDEPTDSIADVVVTDDKVYFTGATTMVYSLDGGFLFEADDPDVERVLGKKLLVDSDGSVVVLGANTLSKFNDNGGLLWKIEEPDLTPLDVVLDDQDHIFVAGNVQLDFTVVAKVDGNGQILWTREYRHPDKDVIMQQEQRMAIAPNGDVVVTAFAVVQRPFATDELLAIKYTSDGNRDWVRRTSGFWANPYGSILPEPDIAVDSNHQVYVTGNGKVIAYDTKGSKLATFEDKTDFPNYLAVDDSDNVFVTTGVNENIHVWKFEQP